MIQRKCSASLVVYLWHCCEPHFALRYSHSCRNLWRGTSTDTEKPRCECSSQSFGIINIGTCVRADTSNTNRPASKSARPAFARTSTFSPVNSRLSPTLAAMTSQQCPISVLLALSRLHDLLYSQSVSLLLLSPNMSLSVELSGRLRLSAWPPEAALAACISDAAALRVSSRSSRFSCLIHAATVLLIKPSHRQCAFGIPTSGHAN